MKLRAIWVFFVLVAVVACGGAAEEPAADADSAAPAAAPEAPMDDAAALEAATEYFVTHYNMHHAGMVAELYKEDAIFLSADGQVQEGRAAIEAAITTAMEASPTLSLDIADRIIGDGWAVSHGSWAVEATPEGAPAPVSTDGHFMTVQEKVEGEWKTAAVITSFHAEPPETTTFAEGSGEPPAELTDSPLAEIAEYYATHFNMGHGDMVASRYAEDGMAAFANLPPASGRAAIAEQLNARIAAGDSPQLTIHEVAAEDLGDGWTLGGGWYEMGSSAGGDTTGAYMMLCREGSDGNMEIYWAVSNAQPATQ